MIAVRVAQQLRVAAALIVTAVSTAAIGCGASRPRAEDIYHDPALRRGALEADHADRELLARLGALPAGEPVSIAGRTYVADRPYHAASGRTCRAVAVGGTATRLACSTEDARWQFVPDVIGGANPFAQSEALGSPAEPSR